jgi:hypothetical protein
MRQERTTVLEDDYPAIVYATALAGSPGAERPSTRAQS